MRIELQISTTGQFRVRVYERGTVTFGLWYANGFRNHDMEFEHFTLIPGQVQLTNNKIKIAI